MPRGLDLGEGEQEPEAAGMIVVVLVDLDRADGFVVEPAVETVAAAAGEADAAGATQRWEADQTWDPEGSCVPGIDGRELERPRNWQKEPKCSVGGHCGTAEGCSSAWQAATENS